MSKIQITALQKGIIGVISTVPGLVGFVNQESEAQSPRILSEKNYAKGISVTNTSKGAEVKLFIVVSINVRTEIVSRELLSAVQSYFKLIGKKLFRINIYIRGVK